MAEKAPVASNVPFSMPMFRAFVPDWLRPWIFVIFIIIIQMNGGWYLGALMNLSGSFSFTTEEVMMIGMCAVVGACVAFPFLFRFKFRFTNKQLLLFWFSVHIVCNVALLTLRSVPLLCIFSFISGFSKLTNTFECASNVQLWVAPRRDFRLWFPFMYVMVFGNMALNAWLSVNIDYWFGSWKMMHWLMIGLMLVVWLAAFLLLRSVRFMPKKPLKGMDWLGALLWVLMMIEGVWIFTFGEYYNWWDGEVFRVVVIMFILTLFFAIQRMRHIRHPYIEPEIFSYRIFVPVLLMFAMAELFNGTPKALQNVFTAGAMGWGSVTTSQFSLYELIGCALACLFALHWYKTFHLTEVYKLMGLGFFCLVGYHVIMYFTIAPDVNIQKLIFPIMLRNFGYILVQIALTLYITDTVSGPHIFQCLVVVGFVRNGFFATITAGTLNFAMRGAKVAATTYALPYSGLDALLVPVKEVLGWICLGGFFFLLVILLFDLPFFRSLFRRLLYLRYARPASSGEGEG